VTAAFNQIAGVAAPSTSRATGRSAQGTVERPATGLSAGWIIAVPEHVRGFWNNLTKSLNPRAAAK
jgi:hypothetical protein